MVLTKSLPVQPRHRRRQSRPPFFSGFLFALALLLALVPPALAVGADEIGSPPQGATLVYFNRPIISFLAQIGSLTPERRAELALQRLQGLDDQVLSQEIVLQDIVVDGKPGIVLTLGGRLLFGIAQDDLDPEQTQSIRMAASDAKQRLIDAFNARLDQRRPAILLRGAGVTLASTVVLMGLIWLAWQLRLRIHDWASRLITRSIERATHAGFDWRRYGYAFTARIVQLLLFFNVLILIYLWITFALSQFPLTYPLGNEMGGIVLTLLGRLGNGIIASIPGVLTVIVIIVLAQAINRTIGNVIEAAAAGSLRVPLVDPETAGATRKILRILVWGVALAVAYPYIPGSDSLAFQGLSVLFGLMLSLGSTGVVSQMMSGTVLAYSRSLRPGDYVQIDVHEGTVSEVGAISTKLITPANAEITIPNSVLVENTVINYSQRLKAGSSLFSTRITIGYDTPWRQVHAMLLMAAKRVTLLQQEPAPYVVQRALTDFYVEYELFVTVLRPGDRVTALSNLNGTIQDVLNEYGVQIMSPQFYEQPPTPLIVPKERWYAAPAAVPDAQESGSKE